MYRRAPRHREDPIYDSDALYRSPIEVLSTKVPKKLPRCRSPASSTRFETWRLETNRMEILEWRVVSICNALPSLEYHFSGRRTKTSQIHHLFSFRLILESSSIISMICHPFHLAYPTLPTEMLKPAQGNRGGGGLGIGNRLEERRQWCFLL